MVDFKRFSVSAGGRLGLCKRLIFSVLAFQRAGAWGGGLSAYVSV